MMVSDSIPSAMTPKFSAAPSRMMDSTIARS